MKGKETKKTKKQIQQPSFSSNLNKGTEKLREENTKVQEKDKKIKMKTPLYSSPPPNINQHCLARKNMRTFAAEVDIL